MMRSRTGTILAVTLITLTVLALWALRADVSHAGPPAAPGAAVPAGKAVEAPAPGTAPEGGSDLHAQIQELDARIQALRGEFHSQLDPLQAQVKSLRDKYEPQLKDLEQQRKELVEQGKPPQVQELDRQEDADLAALADREKAELEKVKQRFDDERKDIRQRYDQRRRELRGAGK